MTRAYPRHLADRSLPLFSIGAVARRLVLSAATIRTWESRYHLVIPARSAVAGGSLRASRSESSRWASAGFLPSATGSRTNRS